MQLVMDVNPKHAFSCVRCALILTLVPCSAKRPRQAGPQPPRLADGVDPSCN